MKEHFPDCEILTMEQRSDSWHQARKGILTASNFGAWLLKDSDQKSRQARESAICKLIAERAGCWEPPTFENEAMKRGTLLESDAVAAFEAATKTKVSQVGFCRSIHGAFGCSPDGLLDGESAGFEGKVPVPSKHIEYRRAGVMPDQYRFQVHGCMAVTGAQSWWFQSWSPGLATLRILVERDNFTEELKGALVAFSEQLESAWKQEREAALIEGVK
jgi:predicted phage-related endonuclease